jgi:hypothetical protein
VWNLSCKNPKLAVCRFIPHNNVVNSVMATTVAQQVPELMIRQLKWSENGESVYAGYCDGAVRCWTFKKPEEV